MENRGKDGVWELSVLATCGWIRGIYPVFLEFIEKKMENRVEDRIWLGIYSIWRMYSQILPRFLSNSLKKIENRGKDSIWELRVLFTCSMNVQNLPRFSRFTYQMENRGKDGIWELSVLLLTCGMSSQNLPRFSGIHWKINGKSGWR